MLVLSRKQGQRIRIGDSIELVVIEVRGDKVRLGFTAPPDVAIHREEVYERVNRQPAEPITNHTSAQRKRGDSPFVATG